MRRLFDSHPMFENVFPLDLQLIEEKNLLHFTWKISTQTFISNIIYKCKIITETVQAKRFYIIQLIALKLLFKSFLKALTFFS